MANEVRKITLTSIGADAGPYFSVQYSTNCSNYSQSEDCTNIFLPSVGSIAYCTVDENTCCLRLTSLGELCTNSVTETLCVLTTTTTLAPTTTTTTLTPTTTTTLAPTTTTTLVPTTTTTLSPTTTTIAPTTTTIAPTTSTTSTQAPTTTTTTVINRYEVELCGGGDGPYIVTLGSGTFPTGIGQAFKLTGSYSGFNGTNCWEVLDDASTASIDYTNVGFGTAFSNCAECNTTTTTTLTPTTTTLAPTTTTLSPTTTTTTTLGCYNCGDGNVRFETSSTDYGQYPTRDVCSGSNECGTFVYDAIDRPNRFNLYDSTGLIATSGWVGYANYSGPWGASLNVTPNGSFTYDFASTTGRYVLVEYGPADPNNPQSDAADWSLTCGTCPTTTTLAPTTTTTTAAPTTTTTTANYAILDWQFSETNTSGTMYLYVNGNLIETRTANDNGTYNVYQGDTIYWILEAAGCAQKANVYSSGIIADAACDNTSVSYTSTTYTVTAGNIGNTITLDMFASCDGGCI